ncbi:riboflavin synthase [Salimicrobium salexigens]|uniref:Riboflavin synthase n=1 Tax=Salimicrobium salexigens TaxID=908941 RepID=A0ABY1KYM8_9BACI|nr:riboflavin synthase [Salimicrobium salexigens]SIS81258.1 riboflavin synthase alpha chain [Salimicrobium salexigens]
MFTGIVEEIGTISSIEQKEEAMDVSIKASVILQDVEEGDSISINGVCLTVTAFTETTASFDVMPETFRATNFKDLAEGSNVNLERALAAGGRFGGHIVSGHIDGTGKITGKTPEANAVYYEIELPEDLIQYFIHKGSIAVDGTSLTVFGVKGNTILVSLIPHTMEHTVLGNKEPGDEVNVECDMIGKYIAHFMKNKNSGEEISSDFLKENGYV